MEFILVLLVFLTVVLLTLVARKAQGGVSFLLYVLTFYWTASYVLRPLFFLYARDNDIDSKVYDIRIGKSSEDFNSILQNIVIGNIGFCLVTFVLVKRKNLKIPRRGSSKISLINSKLINITFMVGILSVLIERSTFRNPISKSLASLVAFTLCAYLWSRSKYNLTRINEFALIAAGIAAILFAAPTSGHFKGLILTPLLVYIYKLQIWRNRKHLLLKFIFGFFLALMFIPFFSFLQKLRLGSDSASVLLSSSKEFPWFLSPLLNLAIRFDQFPRISDVHFAGTGLLGGWRAWGNSIFTSLQWNPTSGREIGSFGTMWNQVITNATIPGARFSPVSFAQGMIAEGLIWDGLGSLLVACALMALIFNVAGKLLDGGFISGVTAFALIGNGTIFESGPVQEFTSISAAIKNLLFLLLLRFILKSHENQISNKH